jgi:hypothetical protein
MKGLLKEWASHPSNWITLPLAIMLTYHMFQGPIQFASWMDQPAHPYANVDLAALLWLGRLFLRFCRIGLYFLFTYSLIWCLVILPYAIYEYIRDEWRWRTKKGLLLYPQAYERWIMKRRLRKWGRKGLLPEALVSDAIALVDLEATMSADEIKKANARVLVEVTSARERSGRDEG